MRIHFIAAIAVLLAVLFLKVSPLEFALLALSILSVLCAEMFNTAVEAVAQAQPATKAMVINPQIQMLRDTKW